MPLNRNRIYLDHAATTPMHPAARAAMAEACALTGNPSSPHAEGRRAKAALEEARARVAAALGWTGTVVFTSGATEAIALALGRGREGPRIVSAGEHQAVLRAAPDAVRIPLTPDGLVDLDALRAALARAKRPLVAVQQVGNETGVIQPLPEVATFVAEAGGLLLADCAQSAAKLPLPRADFLSISAHKFGGPPGVGALLVRDPATLDAIGGQEGGYRPGTPGLPAITAMAAALEIYGRGEHDTHPGEACPERLPQAGSRRGRGPGYTLATRPSRWLEAAATLRAELEADLPDEAEIVAATAPRLPTIGAYRLPGLSAAAQLADLDLAGIAVSAGPACASGALGASHVLAAMGWPEQAAREVIRVSFGPQTTREEISAVLDRYARLATRARAA